MQKKAVIAMSMPSVAGCSDNLAMVEFAKDGKTALVLSSLGRETTALTKVKLSDGSTTEVIAFNDKADCGGIMLDEDTKEVRAVSFNYARTERTFFDQELKGHFDRLEGMGPDKAEVSLVSKTRDEASGSDSGSNWGSHGSGNTSVPMSLLMA